MRCGKALPAPSSVFDKYTPRGLSWMVVVVATVGLMAIGLALGTIASLFESELPYTWRLILMLAFSAIIVLMVVLSVAKVLRARRLAHYCPDCAAALVVKRLSRPEEFGAHKIRMKKE